MTAIDDNPLGYPAEVWRLFRQTPNAGAIGPGPDTRVGETGSHAGRFRLRLSCRVAAGQMTEARFLAWGCPYTIAVGAWLAEWLVGKPLSALEQPPIAPMRASLEIPEDRAHCWLMAQDVLRDLRDN